jgi:hypothetical protein
VANVSSFSGAMPVIPGGEVEIARVTRTDGSGGVAAVGTTWATGSNFFSTSLTFVADGASTYALEFFAPLVYSPTLANQLALRISASDGTSDGGIIGFAGNAAAEGQSVFSRVFVVPSAGAATYNVRFAASTSVGQLYCGVGGVGAYVPAYLRAVKIVNQNDGLKPVWTPPIVTRLPSQATFGDAVLFAADATNGVYWHLSYDGLGTYPWKFVGGAPLVDVVTGGSATASASYVALGGPTLSIALPGDYDISASFDAGYNGSGGCAMGVQIGAGSDEDYAWGITEAPGYNTTHVATYRKTVSSAVTLTSKVKSPQSVSITFSGRVLRATPVRVKAA